MIELAGGKGKKWTYVFCPFYKKEEPVNLRCEGPIKNTKLILQFPNKAEKEAYQKKYCSCKNCSECEIYKMLDKKY